MQVKIFKKKCTEKKFHHVTSSSTYSPDPIRLIFIPFLGAVPIVCLTGKNWEPKLLGLPLLFKGTVMIPVLPAGTWTGTKGIVGIISRGTTVFEECECKEVTAPHPNNADVWTVFCWDASAEVTGDEHAEKVVRNGVSSQLEKTVVAVEVLVLTEVVKITVCCSDLKSLELFNLVSDADIVDIEDKNNGSSISCFTKVLQSMKDPKKKKYK